MNRTTALQRASVFVHDTERSLSFYRDILGMTVLNTLDLEGPWIARRLGLDDCKLRITYLTAEDSPIARIGLFEVYDPRPPVLAPPRPDVVHRGQVLLVFDSPHIPAIHRAVQAQNYPTLCPPLSLRGAKGGTFSEYIFFDPDGVTIDLLSYTPDPGAVVSDAAVRTARPADSPNKTSPLLRTSIFVRNTEQSLALYRDILGMTVLEQREIGGPQVGRLLGLKDCRVRATYLTAEDSPVGRIALFEVLDLQPPELPRPPTHTVHRGQTSLVLGTREAPALYRDLKAQGYDFMCEPTDSTRPGVGTTTEMIFFDPDGVLVALIQFTPEQQR